MKFTKMQGIGNDYIYVNCFEEQIVHRSRILLVRQVRSSIRLRKS